MNKAQELIDNTEQPGWDKEALMSKFYPKIVETPPKQEKLARGFRMVYNKPSSPTAENIVDKIEKDGVGIKKPRFKDNPRKSLFRRKRK